MSRTTNYCQICGTAVEYLQHNGRIRPTCPNCGHIEYYDPKVAVLAFIRQENQLLLVQRGMDPGMGKWACPAGFVDYDEAPADATIREVREETGLDVSILRLLDVFPRLDHGLADIVICYEAAVVGGVLQADDDAIDAGWFAKDQLPELVFYPSITLAQRWQNDEL